MNYGYQEIQRVMKEARVSFEEADRALKKSRGNIGEAVILALRKKNGQDGLFERGIDAFVRLFRYRVRIEKDGRKYFDLALWIIGVVMFMAEIALSYGKTFTIYAVIALIILFSGSKLTLEPRAARDAEPELVEAEPMQEDEVLQNYPDEEVSEQEGYNSVEV